MIALVSSDPWLTVGIALIAAVAALSGARIAAVTAGRRQRAQLQADAERQRTELRHERMLAELAELRGVLDDAARDITDAERAMLNATSAWIADVTVSDALRDALQGKWTRCGAAPNGSGSGSGQMRFERLTGPPPNCSFGSWGRSGAMGPTWRSRPERKRWSNRGPASYEIATHSSSGHLRSTDRKD